MNGEGRRNGVEAVGREIDQLARTAGRWYFVHGGAGSVMSAGAMGRASFQDVSTFLRKIEPVSSGDAPAVAQHTRV